MNIIIIGGLSDDKFISKAKPLIDNTLVTKVFLFRYNGNPFIADSKISKITTSRSGKVGIPKLLYNLYTLFFCLYLLIFKKIKILFGFYLYPHGLLISILGIIFSKKFVLIVPGTDLKMLTENPKHTKFFNKASFIGMRGSNSIEKMVHLGFEKEKLFILPNFIEEDFINKPINATPKEYDIVFTGYLRKLKRIDLLIKLVYEIKKSFPGIKCLIVGEGPEKASLEHLSRKLNLESNITFLPYTNPIEKILIKSRIFILTSESEGLPMSLIEAMSIGLPVISSDINDISDIIEHGVNGYLVDPYDFNSFYTFTNHLLKDDEKQIEMGKRARIKIQILYKKEYSYNAVYATWHDILAQLQ